MASRGLLLGVAPAAAIGRDTPAGLLRGDLDLELLVCSSRGGVFLGGEGGIARAEHGLGDVEGGGRRQGGAA